MWFPKSTLPSLPSRRCILAPESGAVLVGLVHLDLDQLEVWKGLQLVQHAVPNVHGHILRGAAGIGGRGLDLSAGSLQVILGE